MNLSLLSLQINQPKDQPEAINFRPPCWPPTPDWVPIYDAQGNPVCRYSDPTWPLDTWKGSPLKLSFGDGKTRGRRLDRANADLLRQCVVWFAWGPRGCRTAASLQNRFTTIKPLFVACSEEGIVASDLMRFPTVIDKVATFLQPSNFRHAITVLHDLLDASEHLGFCLLNQDGLARLAKLRPKHNSEQTPYIPPRIWTYQLNRLRECLQDYADHQKRIEDCFRFCLDAYAHNYGSLSSAVDRRHSAYAPFQNKKSYPSYQYYGSFKLTAAHFGITELLERWTGLFAQQKGKKQISKFSQYLDLVSKVGLAYLLNFSLMRIEEGYSLRSDCLWIEHDEKFGEIPMLVGETTKTDMDADARWPVSKSAILAINAMKHIAALRMHCARERKDVGTSKEDEVNPYLISFGYEPWSMSRRESQPYKIRPRTNEYGSLLSTFPQLLDKSQITITEEDLRLARLVTPTLNEEAFKVGALWPFAWHQLRRTGAVNMQASNLVEDSSLQLQLKHHSRVMTLFYGRNHSRLILSEETRTLFLNTMYQEVARSLKLIASTRFVSPFGESRKESIVTFIKEADVHVLAKGVKQGSVAVRPIRVGFCVNHRPCPYGGIESITHCLGGDDEKGCPDLLVDVKKEASIKLYEKLVESQLAVVHPNSPRYQSLQGEKRALGKFYAVVQAQNR